MLSKFDSYYNLIKRSYDLSLNLSEDEKEEKIELERIYSLAFFNCILLSSIKKTNEIKIEKKIEVENEQEITKISLVFSAHANDIFFYHNIQDFSLLKQENLLEKAIENTNTINEKQDENIQQAIINANPVQQIDEIKENENEKEENNKKNDTQTIEYETIKTGEVQEVETVPVSSVIDYNAIIEEATKKDEIIIEEAPKIEKTETENKELTSDINNKNNYQCTKYPDDNGNKKKNTFFYDQYFITHNDLKIKVNVFPMKYSSHDEPVATDIFVTFKGSNGIFRGYKSNDNGIKTIRATFDNLEFLITGRWIAGKFTSTIKLLKAAEINIKSNEVRPKNPTSTTHLLISTSNLRLHIFPTDWINHTNLGLVGTIVYSENDQTIFLPNPQYQTPIQKDNSNDFLEAYWQGSEENTTLEVNIEN